MSARRPVTLRLHRWSALASGLVACVPLQPDLPIDLCGNAIAQIGAGSNRPAFAGEPDAGAVSAFTDSAPSYVSLGNPGALNITGPITVAAWVSPSNFSALTRTIVGRGYDGANEGLYFRLDAGSVKFGSYNGSEHQASWAIGLGEWDLPSAKLLVGVYTGAAWKIYADAIERASSTDAVGPLATAKGWYIGATDIAGSVSRGYLGKMWSVNIWNRALSPAEIWALYDPATRWDLYWTPSRRSYGIVAPPAAGGWGPLLGQSRNRLVFA